MKAVVWVMKESSFGVGNQQTQEAEYNKPATLELEMEKGNVGT